MKEKVERMITALLPDAIPGKDFAVEIDSANKAHIIYWNSGKLGEFPGLEKLRDVFLRYAQKLKEKMPNYDASDPLPYLAEQPKARRMTIDSLPKVDVQTFGNTVFVREKK